MYTARRSEVNGKCSNQANLLVIVNGENRYFMAIKNFSRLLKSLNQTHKRASHFRMKFLNGV